MTITPSENQQKSNLPVCYNCQYPKSNDDPFCRQCGQKHTDLQDGVFHFIAEFFTQLISLDGRVFRTMGLLFARPGELTNEFMRGRRKRYLSPVQIYLFSTFLFFFAFGSWAQPNASELAKIELDSVPDQQEILSSEDSPIPDVPTTVEDSTSQDTTAEKTKVEQQTTDKTEAANSETNGKTTGDSIQPNDDSSSEKNVKPGKQANPNSKTWINVRLPNSEARFTEEEFRRFATMSDEDISKALSSHHMEPYRWLVILLRNTSKLTTEIGVQRYYTTLVAIASQVALVMLPFLAILLRILFWRSSQSLLQSFVLSSHIHVFTSFLLTPFFLLGFSGATIFVVGAMIGGLHLAFTLRNVFHESWFWTLFKMGFLSGCYAITLIIGFGIIGAVALFLY